MRDAAVIRKSNIPLDDLYTLRFAAGRAPTREPLPRCLTGSPRAADLPPADPPPAGKPLAGVRVALDPGAPRRTLGAVGGTLVPDRRHGCRSWKAR